MKINKVAVYIVDNKCTHTPPHSIFDIDYNTCIYMQKKHLKMMKCEFELLGFCEF